MMKVTKNEITFFTVFMSVLTLIYFGASVAFGQDVSAAPAVASLPQALQQAQGILNQLNNGWVMTAGVIIVELLMRLVKTEDPKSLLYVISNVFKMIGQGCDFLAKLLDNVLQNLKPKA